VQVMAGTGGGQILRVDLTNGQCFREQLPAEVMTAALGGRGLGAALLSGTAGGDPFAPGKPLVFSSGPLCGTATPLSTRCVVTGHSPLTGTLFSCSSGGDFARYLKKAGLAALVIQGESSTPCLLQVAPDAVSLAPATALWGLDTVATLQQLSGEGGCAVIGPAGENGVLYASIETAHGEPFDRGGLGAVLGQKKLKAITLNGAATTAVADQPAFDKALEDLLRLFRASPFLYGPLGIRQYGTAALVDLLSRRGMLPGVNFNGFAGQSAQWNAAALHRRYNTQGGGCHDCPVACKRLLPDGSLLPEYDALAGFGGLCGLAGLDEIVQLCRQCRMLGLDPVSAAATLALWSELRGQELDSGLISRLLTEIATGGAQDPSLALGAARYAAALQQPGKAMTVKGLELPPYDPRASTGLALAYATSPHGGSHLPAWPIASEILRKPVPTDRFSFDGKARVIAMFEDANAAVDALPLCRFASAAVELEELAALLAAVTGQSYCAADLGRIGRRIILQERAFNQGCGFTAADDSLPQRFFTEPANGLASLDRHRFEQELAAYHRIRAAQCL